eukprot:CAMPEP_0185846386 /NCGR_PEP_ID=MMETSP1354-20130828/2045_1 /TAXON_ID=708628 /ORGANISM="Erythrolobus madagascarensis, Strain CCMP3276" /LENGTH=322 /DNA_ID=CAMNT_0028546515 /DNA_START=193 /DNA_END=1161 /DNA_ORIENTATION=+
MAARPPSTPQRSDWRRGSPAFGDPYSTPLLREHNASSGLRRSKPSSLRLVPSDPDLTGLDCLGVPEDILGLNPARLGNNDESPLLPNPAAFAINNSPAIPGMPHLVAEASGTYSARVERARSYSSNTPPIDHDSSTKRDSKRTKGREFATANSSDYGRLESREVDGCNASKGAAEGDTCRRSEWSGGEDDGQNQEGEEEEEEEEELEEEDIDEEDEGHSEKMECSAVKGREQGESRGLLKRDAKAGDVFRKGPVVFSSGGVRKALRWPRRRPKNIKGLRKNYTALKEITREMGSRAVELANELKALRREENELTLKMEETRN